MEIVETDDTSKMSNEIQQKFTCEICIEPAMLSQKFGHDTDSVHNICFIVRCMLFVSYYFSTTFRLLSIYKTVHYHEILVNTSLFEQFKLNKSYNYKFDVEFCD